LIISLALKATSLGGGALLEKFACLSAGNIVL